MFHRVRILHHLVDDYTNKKPISKKKLNTVIALIVNYIRTKSYLEIVDFDKNYLDIKKQEKKDLEYQLLDFGRNYKVIEIKDGFGRRRKYTTDDLVELIGPNWIDKYLTNMLKILVYVINDKYLDKVDNKDYLTIINETYLIDKSKIEGNEKINFIYFNL